MGAGTTEGVGALAENCAICDSNLPDSTPKCPTCGFPTLLLPEARVALEEERKEKAAAAPPPAPAPMVTMVLPFAEATAAMPPVNAGALTMDQAAVALQASLKIAQLLGMDTTEVANALTSAAMSAARGSLPEAQKVLQDAYDKLEPETSQKFESLAVSLEEQEGRLREEGIAADVAREVSRARRAYDEGARIDAVEALQKAAKQMGELETAWKTVKETLLRIDTLREVGKHLGMDLSKVDERLTEVRQTLSEENLSASALNEAGTQGGAALVLLHEQVRNQIALLGQDAIRALKAHPPPAAQREKAELRLKQVLAHARAGRLKEASEEMVAFRTTFLGAAEPGAAASPATAASSAPATSSATAAVAKLIAAAEPAATPATPSPEASTSAASPSAEAATPSAVPTAAEAAAAPKAAPEASAAPPEEKRPSTPSAPAAPATAEAAPAGPARPLGEIIAEARTLGAKLKERQKKKQDVKDASARLKELLDLIKAGKVAEADKKLREVRAALGED